MTKKILKGTYCLIIHLSKDTTIEVGKRGSINFARVTMYMLVLLLTPLKVV